MALIISMILLGLGVIGVRYIGLRKWQTEEKRKLQLKERDAEVMRISNLIESKKKELAYQQEIVLKNK
jgi:hypothetical protein